MTNPEIGKKELEKVVGGIGNGHQTDWRWIVDYLVPAHLEELVEQLPKADLEELKALKNNKKASDNDFVIWGIAHTSYFVVQNAVMQDMLRNA